MSNDTPGTTPLLTTVVKQVRDYAAKIIILVVQALVLLLVFPFDPAVFFVTASLALLSVAAFMNAKRKGERKYYFLCAVTATLTIVWAGLAPLLHVSGPIYFIKKSDNFSLDALLKGQLPVTKSLSVSSRVSAGTILVLGDPIRRITFPYILALHYPNDSMQLIEKAYSTRPYILFPMRMAFHFGSADIGGANPTVFQTVLLPMRTFVLEGKKKTNKPAFSFAAGATTTTLLKHTPSSRPEDAPWNAVESPDMSDSLLRYITLIDSAIEHASSGDGESMGDLLDEALLLAPSSAERSRVCLILSSYFRQALAGELGGFQSLSLTNRAFKALDRPGMNHENATWLERWIARELYRHYDHYGTLFAPNKESLLRIALPEESVSSVLSNLRTDDEEAVGIAAVRALTAKVEKGSFQELEDENAGLGTITAESHRLGALSADELSRELQQASDTQTRAMLIDLAIGNIPGKLDVTMTFDQILAKLNILEKSARTLPTRYSEKYIPLIESVRVNARFSYNILGNGDPDKSQRILLKAILDLKEFQSDYGKILGNTLLSLATGKGDSKPEFAMFLPPSTRYWWEKDYLNWQLCQSMKFSMFYAEQDHLSYQDILSNIGDPMNLTVDKMGRPFLPSMFMLAYATENENGRQHKFFVREIEKSLNLNYSALKNFLGLNQPSIKSK
ncbi:MAG: hypothetical protein V4447_06745 [Pseudomonadota bacterium]